MNPVRVGVFLVAAGVLVVAVATGMFLYFFHSSSFSSDVADWGAFGSYVGGVLGASISTLALIGAVIAIYQQHKTDKKVNDHTVASDLMRSIERLEDDIDRRLVDCEFNIKYLDGDVRLKTDALKVLTELSLSNFVAHLIPQYSADPDEVVRRIIDNTLSEPEKLEKIRMYELFGNTCSKLTFLRDLLIKHKVLAGHNVVTLYYKSKYSVAVDRLRNAYYPVESWDEIEKI